MITLQTITEYILIRPLFLNQNKVISDIISFGLNKYGFCKSKEEVILFSKFNNVLPDVFNLQEFPDLIISPNGLERITEREITSNNLDCINIEKGIDVLVNIFGLSYLIIGKKPGYDHENHILSLLPEGVLAGIFAVTYFEKEIIGNCNNIIVHLLENKPFLMNHSVSEAASVLFLLFVLSKGIDNVWSDLYLLGNDMNNIFKKPYEFDIQTTWRKILEIQLRFLQKLY
jgi:hypothetical protein